MIIITGASRGIGNYLTKKFLEEGQEVFGTYNNTIPKDINQELLSKVDVSDYSSVENWIKSLTKKRFSVDKLCRHQL